MNSHWRVKKRVPRFSIRELRKFSELPEVLNRQ